MNLDFLKTSHESFVRRLAYVLDGHESINQYPKIIRDPSSSELGQWIQECQHIYLVAEFEALKVAHAEFHKHSHELIVLYRTGYKGCLTALKSDFDTLSANVIEAIGNLATVLGSHSQTNDHQVK